MKSLKRPHVGFTAFARGLSTNNLGGNAILTDAWLDYLRRLVAVGADHVQFLAPESVADAVKLGAIAKDAGVSEVSVLYCTFGPVCPCADANAAFQKFTEVFDVAKALMETFTGMATKRIFSPSFLRGLMDADRGLASPDDAAKQTKFLVRLLEYLKKDNRGESFELVLEPLNRFEMRGPNTVAETVEIIKEAHAAQRMTVGVDSFHSFMECGGNIARMWAEFASHIGMIHASALNRGHFYDDAVWMEPLFRDIGRNKAFNNVPIVVEAFCGETDPAFLPVLGIHDVSSCSAAEMAAGNLSCLRSWLG